MSSARARTVALEARVERRLLVAIMSQASDRPEVLVPSVKVACIDSDSSFVLSTEMAVGTILRHERA